MVRAPIRARSPMLTNAPIEASGAMTALGATLASGCTPAGVDGFGAKSSAARANARYGCDARRDDTPAGSVTSADSDMITADARVDCSCAAYFGFVKKVRSPG